MTVAKMDARYRARCESDRLRAERSHARFATYARAWDAAGKLADPVAVANARHAAHAEYGRALGRDRAAAVAEA